MKIHPILPIAVLVLLHSVAIFAMDPKTAAKVTEEIGKELGVFRTQATSSKTVIDRTTVGRSCDENNSFSISGSSSATSEASVVAKNLVATVAPLQTELQCIIAEKRKGVDAVFAEARQAKSDDGWNKAITIAKRASIYWDGVIRDIKEAQISEEEAMHERNYFVEKAGLAEVNQLKIRPIGNSWESRNDRASGVMRLVREKVWPVVLQAMKTFEEHPSEARMFAVRELASVSTSAFAVAFAATASVTASYYSEADDVAAACYASVYAAYTDDASISAAVYSATTLSMPSSSYFYNFDYAYAHAYTSSISAASAASVASLEEAMEAVEVAEAILEAVTSVAANARDQIQGYHVQEQEDCDWIVSVAQEVVTFARAVEGFKKEQEAAAAVLDGRGEMEDRSQNTEYRVQVIGNKKKAAIAEIKALEKSPCADDRDAKRKRFATIMKIIHEKIGSPALEKMKGFVEDPSDVTMRAACSPYIASMSAAEAVEFVENAKVFFAEAPNYALEPRKKNKLNPILGENIICSVNAINNIKIFFEAVAAFKVEQEAGSTTAEEKEWEIAEKNALRDIETSKQALEHAKTEKETAVKGLNRVPSKLTSTDEVQGVDGAQKQFAAEVEVGKSSSFPATSLHGKYYDNGTYSDFQVKELAEELAEARVVAAETTLRTIIERGLSERSKADLLEAKEKEKNILQALEEAKAYARTEQVEEKATLGDSSSCRKEAVASLEKSIEYWNGAKHSINQSVECAQRNYKKDPSNLTQCLDLPTAYSLQPTASIRPVGRIVTKRVPEIEESLAVDYKLAAEQSEQASEYSRRAAEAHVKTGEDSQCEEIIGRGETREWSKKIMRWREGIRWREAGKSMQLSADCRVKGIEARSIGNIGKEDYSKQYAEAAEIFQQAAEKMIEAVQSLLAGKEKNMTGLSIENCSPQWSEGCFLQSEGMSKKYRIQELEAQEIGKKELATGYREAVEISQQAADQYKKSALLFGSGNTSQVVHWNGEGLCWKEGGLSLQKKSDCQAKAIEAQESGKTEIAEGYREVGATFQQAADQYRQLALNSLPGASSHANGFLGPCLHKKADYQLKATEAKEVGNTELVATYQEMASILQQAADKSEQLFKTSAAGKVNEKFSWHLVGKSLQKKTVYQIKSIEAEGTGNRQLAAAYQEVVTTLQQAVDQNELAAQTYAAGKKDKASRYDLVGKYLLSKANCQGKAAIKKAKIESEIIEKSLVANNLSQEVYQNLPSKPTEAAKCFVAPGLEASSSFCTLNFCAPSTSCSSSASATLQTGSQILGGDTNLEVLSKKARQSNLTTQALSIYCDHWILETGCTPGSANLSDYVLNAIKNDAPSQYIITYEKCRDNACKMHQLGANFLALVWIQMSEDMQQAIEDSIYYEKSKDSDTWGEAAEETYNMVKYKEKYLEAVIFSQAPEIVSEWEQVVKQSSSAVEYFRNRRN